METNERQNGRTLDRTLGCVVGGAAGDALGYEVEFLSWSRIRHRFGPEGIREYQLDSRGVAPFSDDTQMALFTAAGILDGMTRGAMRGTVDRLDTYCRNSYLDWLHTQEWVGRKKDASVCTWLMDVPELYVRRAPGTTCMSALRDCTRGLVPHNDSCGCGGVMRTAPMALLSYIHGPADGDSRNRSDMSAAEAARITHKHPLGFFPSAILNHVLMEILDGKADDPDLLPQVVGDSSAYLPGIRSEEDGGRTYGELWPKAVTTQQDLVQKALDLAGTDIPDVAAIESIGGGWTGHEALAIAVYSAVKHRHSFEDALVSAVNHSGDSDSTGAVCGNIMGCLLGRKAIPDKFIGNLECLDVLEEIARDLWTGCIIGEYEERDTPEKQRWFEKYCLHHWER